MIFHSPKIPIPIPPIETFMASFVISYHQHSMNPLMLLIRHQGHQNGGFNPSDAVHFDNCNVFLYFLINSKL